MPKAIAIEIRGAAPNLTILEHGAKRPKSSQGGLFDDHLLCDSHEGLTGELDRYGVAFIRRLNAARSRAAHGTLSIENPEPRKLMRFAESIVWRTVASSIGNANGNELGPRYRELTASVFEDVRARTALFACASGLTLKNDPLKLATQPKRARHDGKILWRFEMAGCCFILFMNEPNLPSDFDRARADLANPLSVARLNEMDALDWEAMDRIMKSLKRITR